MATRMMDALMRRSLGRTPRQAFRQGRDEWTPEQRMATTSCRILTLTGHDHNLPAPRCPWPSLCRDHKAKTREG